MSITKDVSVRLKMSGYEKVTAELSGVEEQQKRLRTATIDVDANIEDWEAKASEVLAQAKAMGADRVRVNMTVSDDEAIEKVAAFKGLVAASGLERLNLAVTIDQHKLDESLAEAEVKISLFKRSMRGAIGGIMSGGPMSGIGSSEGIGIMGPAIGAGVMAAPAALAGGVGIASLLAPLAGAYLGYQKLTAAQVLSTAANKKLRTEQLAVASATGKSKKAAEAKLAVDQKAADKADKNTAALKKEFGAVNEFMKALKKTEGVFEKWAAPLSKPIFAMLDKGLSFVKPLLGDITPVVKAMTPLLGQMIGALGTSIKSGGIKDFFQWVAQNGPSSFKAIMGLVGAVGNLVGVLIKGIGAQNSTTFLKGLTSAVSGLAPVVSILAHAFGWLMGVIFHNRALVVALGIALAVIGGPITTVVGALLALGAAVSWVTQHWKTIEHVAVDVWHAIYAAVKAAVSFIIDIVKRWVGLVKDEIKLVIDVFVDLPKNILHAVAGFGKLLWDAGVHLIEGLIDGIGSMIGKAVQSIKHLGSSVIGGAKAIFHINSPSRVFAEIGIGIGEGLIKGITQIAPSVMSTLKKVLGQATQYAKGVTSNALSGAGLANITNPNGGKVTGKEITSGLRSQLSVMHRFAADLRKLKSRGMSGEALQQIIAMGPTQGLEYAHAILSAGIVGQVSNMIGQESRSATRLGNEAATDIYGRRIEQLLTKLAHTLENSKSEINFNGIVTDPDAVARKIQQLLRDFKRHNGNRSLGLS